MIDRAELARTLQVIHAHRAAFAKMQSEVVGMIEAFAASVTGAAAGAGDPAVAELADGVRAGAGVIGQAFDRFIATLDRRAEDIEGQVWRVMGKAGR